MFGLNPALIGFMLTQKADEILKGEIPGELKVIERTENKIVLVPAEAPEFSGMTLNAVHVSVTYKNVEFILRDK